MKKIICGVFVLFACTFIFGKAKKVPAQSFLCMDTVCSVNLYDDGTEKIYKEISDCLLKIERTFSSTDKNSFLYKLNENGYTKNFTGDFLEFLSLYQPAYAVSKISDGAFDLSVNPLIELWNIKAENPKVPAEEDIKKTLSKVGWKNLPDATSEEDLNKPLFQFGEAGMSINFGAAAKGYAADCICAILRRNKVQKAIVDLGGNIYCYGKKENGKPWTVGIKNPEEPAGNPLLKLTTESTSVVTSGTYERFFIQDGKKYHHILDPKTGYPVDNDLASVTIICRSSTAADIFSTTFFVLGQDEAIKRLSEFEWIFFTNLEAVFVYKDGTVTATPGLKGKLEFYGNSDGRQIQYISNVKHLDLEATKKAAEKKAVEIGGRF